MIRQNERRSDIKTQPQKLNRLPSRSEQSPHFAEHINVVRVQSRTFRGIADLFINVARATQSTHKAITDLILPQKIPCSTHKTSLRSCPHKRRFMQVGSKLRTCSLTELAIQVTPPTQNGHASSPMESRKRYQCVNLMSEPGKCPRAVFKAQAPPSLDGS